MLLYKAAPALVAKFGGRGFPQVLLATPAVSCGAGEKKDGTLNIRKRGAAIEIVFHLFGIYRAAPKLGGCGVVEVPLAATTLLPLPAGGSEEE